MSEGPSKDLIFKAEDERSSYQPGNNHLLLIGIDAYADKRIPDLKNARLDAEALSKLLCEQYAFDGEVIQLLDEDATRARIYEALDHFTDKLTEKDNLLIFFSGHGYYRQNQNRGYLVSADTKIGAFHTFISNTVLLEDYLPNIPARHVVLIVDSCFSGSLFKNISPNTGQYSDQALRKMMEKRSRHGIAAGSIELVSDGLTGKHSPFAKSLLNQLKTNQQSHLPILDLFHPVSQETTYSANQRPVYGVLAKSQHIPGAQFVLSRRPNQAQDYHTAEQANTAQAWKKFLQTYPNSTQKAEIETRITALQEQEAWTEAQKRNSITAYRSYRQQFPDGAHRSDALDNMEQLEADQDWLRAQRRNTISGYERFLDSHPRCQQRSEAKAAIEGLLASAEEADRKREAKKPPQATEEQSQPAKKTQSRKAEAPPASDIIPLPNMIHIPGGTFQMGSNERDEEKPVHSVTVSSFYLAETTVTFKQYDYFCEQTGHEKLHDEGWGRGTRPVINVSWEDTQTYIQWLNQQPGQSGWRLPTEAEWEYAAGGGASNRTRYAGTTNEDSLERYAWYHKNAERKTHPVGQKLPNDLGLYDMSGNVWEWCHDWYSSDYYGNSPSQDPAGPLSGTYRVFRGGSWRLYPQYLRVAFRYSNSPYYRGSSIGFRLSRTP